MELKLNEDEIFLAIVLFAQNEKGIRLNEESFVKLSTKNGKVIEATIGGIK